MPYWSHRLLELVAAQNLKVLPTCRQQIAHNQTIEMYTSTTEFTSSSFFTETLLLRLQPDERQITRSLCLNPAGIGSTGNVFVKMFDMLIASSSDRFPWQRPSIYNCKLTETK